MDLVEFIKIIRKNIFWLRVEIGFADFTGLLLM